MRLPSVLAADILIGMGGLLFSMFLFALSLWLKLQPVERIEAAYRQGRPICHCTELGEIMLLDKTLEKVTVKRYVCPKCGDIQGRKINP